MIDAKDLQIGNWVNREYWNPHPTEPSIELDACLIYSIQSDRVSVRINDKKVIARISTEKIHPIPLTPEILEKCGFECEGWLRINEHEDEHIFEIRYQETDYKVCFVKETYGGCTDHSIRFKDGHDIIYLKKELQYLHDLQNLYYALTKQELEYKP